MNSRGIFYFFLRYLSPSHLPQLDLPFTEVASILSRQFPNVFTCESRALPEVGPLSAIALMEPLLPVMPSTLGVTPLTLIGNNCFEINYFFSVIGRHVTQSILFPPLFGGVF
jgi:hypothetical protein